VRREFGRQRPRDLTASLMSCAGAIEIAVHGWDIRAACGSPQPIPSALADRMLQLAALLVTDTTRAGQFGEPFPASGNATAGDRLVAFLGRNPAWPAAASQRPLPRWLSAPARTGLPGRPGAAAGRVQFDPASAPGDSDTVLPRIQAEF
jgi:hypothetical protein